MKKFLLLYTAILCIITPLIGSEVVIKNLHHDALKNVSTIFKPVIPSSNPDNLTLKMEYTLLPKYMLALFPIDLIKKHFEYTNPWLTEEAAVRRKIQYLSTPEYLEEEKKRICEKVGIAMGEIGQDRLVLTLVDGANQLPAVVQWIYKNNGQENKLTYMGEDHTSEFCTKVAKHLIDQGNYTLFLEESAALSSFIKTKKGTIKETIKKQSNSKKTGEIIENKLKETPITNARKIIDPSLEEVIELSESTKAGLLYLIAGAYSIKETRYFTKFEYVPYQMSIAEQSFMKEQFKSNMDKLLDYIRDALIIRNIRDEIAKRQTQGNIFIRMGANHLICQEKALTNLYGPPLSVNVYQNGKDVSFENCLHPNSLHEQIEKTQKELEPEIKILGDLLEIGKKISTEIYQYMSEHNSNNIQSYNISFVSNEINRLSNIIDACQKSQACTSHFREIGALIDNNGYFLKINRHYITKSH